MNNQKKGRLGEKIAQKYLVKKGYTILHQNWTCQWGELDIVAKKGNHLYLVEVKYRTSYKYGDAHEAINYFKLKHLARTARHYLFSQKLFDVSWQFDVICITNFGLKFDLDHFEAVELPHFS